MNEIKQIQDIALFVPPHAALALLSKTDQKI